MKREEEEEAIEEGEEGWTERGGPTERKIDGPSQTERDRDTRKAHPLLQDFLQNPCVLQCFRLKAKTWLTSDREER